MWLVLRFDFHSAFSLSLSSLPVLPVSLPRRAEHFEIEHREHGTRKHGDQQIHEQLVGEQARAEHAELRGEGAGWGAGSGECGAGQSYS